MNRRHFLQRTAAGALLAPLGLGPAPWRSYHLAYAMGSRFNDRFFLRAGSHDLQYRRGKTRATEPEFASLNLWTHGRESNAGFTGRM